MESDQCKKTLGKSSKRHTLIKDVTSDVRFDERKKNYRGNGRYANLQKGPKPTTKSIEVTTPKLIGHYETDIYGKNLILDGSDGIRVYNLPIERREKEEINDLDDDHVVDDWEQLAESISTLKISETEIFIPDCCELNLNLLKGYMPLSGGGNLVSFCNVVRDRTAGMRWLVKNYEMVKCEDGTRLFDVDFFAGNGAMCRIMTSEFRQLGEELVLAVILYKGTYFIFDVTDNEDYSELNNMRSFAGLRFEDFVSRGINGEENEPSNGDKNNYKDARKYYNVAKLTFDNFKLVISGEVDCVIPGSSAAIGKKPKACDFIELKTSSPLEDRYDQSRMSRTFRGCKISSWFAQCCLMGMKHVVVGIREEMGDEMTCNRTQAFTLEELRQHSNGSWSKNRCFDYLKKFLNIVKEKVVEDNPQIYNVFVVKDAMISGPEKKKISDDESLPNISEAVELIGNLEKKIKNQ